MMYSVGSYIFSDDFDRFYQLIKQGNFILYATNKGTTSIKTGDSRTFKGNRYRLSKRFQADGIVFLDPATQFNPERFKLESIKTTHEDYTFAIPRASIFTNIITIVEEAKEKFIKHSKCNPTL